MKQKIEVRQKIEVSFIVSRQIIQLRCYTIHDNGHSNCVEYDLTIPNAKRLSDDIFKLTRNEEHVNK